MIVNVFLDSCFNREKDIKDQQQNESTLNKKNNTCNMVVTIAQNFSINQIYPPHKATYIEKF